MSFSCPHFDVQRDYCLLLEADCVAGQPGCVLRHTSVFYVPAEERLKAKASATASPKPPAPAGTRPPERGATPGAAGS